MLPSALRVTFVDTPYETQLNAFAMVVMALVTVNGEKMDDGEPRKSDFNITALCLSLLLPAIKRAQEFAKQHIKVQVPSLLQRPCESQRNWPFGIKSDWILDLSIDED